MHFNPGANLPESGGRLGQGSAMPEMMPGNAELSARSLVQAFEKVACPKSEIAKYAQR
jgi:hypothetical protein